ncbi:helix-turn-helix domain-containing protein, partial [Patulibacter sp. NPDC049589]|uniref:helix-turn-helix domain-containing protein n=1 Tax=Patulibacter sp. NPDC049589 TaxID=3154731 RepID=UPI00342E91B7
DRGPLRGPRSLKRRDLMIGAADYRHTGGFRLSRDLDAARAFVTSELGGLAGGGATGERSREALLAVVAPQGGLAAAARVLGVHRNTVLQRVRRAEELRGRPATERPAELHAALLLAAVLGPAALAS